MSIAVGQFELLYEQKLSKPNQGLFIIVLNKNVVICAKIMCAIHAYHLDDQGHLTLVAQHDSVANYWRRSLTCSLIYQE